MLKGQTLVGKTFRHIQANQIVVRVIDYNFTTDTINFHYMNTERYYKGIFTMTKSRFLETYEECMYDEKTEKVKLISFTVGDLIEHKEAKITYRVIEYIPNQQAYILQSRFNRFSVPAEEIHRNFIKVEKMDTLQDNDPVNHPSHYGGDTTYEAIKVIEAWGLGFNLGNSVKYICRAGKKDDVISDLMKARWYLDREISNLQNNVVPDWDKKEEEGPSNIMPTNTIRDEVKNDYPSRYR